MKFVPKVLALSGSIRKNSLNTKLLKCVVHEIEQYKADVTYVDLKDFPMPFYNGDVEDEEGLPLHALALKKMILEHDGLIIASPEYNGSVSPVLKNMIDWITRKGPEDKITGNCFRDKAALLISASPSVYGGYRALQHLRFILESIGVFVLPDQKTVSFAHNAFTAEGSLIDASQQKEVRAISEKYADFIGRLKTPFLG